MLTVIGKGVSRFGLSELDGGICWWVVSGVETVTICEENRRMKEAIVEQLSEATGGTVPFAARYGGVGRPFMEAPYCRRYGKKAIIKQWFGWDC